MSSDIQIKLEELIDQLVKSLPAPEKLSAESFSPVLNNIESLGMFAGENKLLGFQDVCLMLQETFSDLIEDSELSTKQYDLLNQWRILAANYVRDGKESTASALVNFFTNSELNSSVNIDDLDVLKEMLIEQGIRNETVKGNIASLLSDSINILEVRNTIEIESLNEKLNELVEALTGTELNGLQDLCLLIQENINDLVKADQELSEQQKKLLLLTLNQLQKCLSDKSDDTSVINLTNTLKNTSWPSPLSDTDANIIIEMFNANVEEDKPEIEEPLAELQNKLNIIAAKVSTEQKEIIKELGDTTEEIGLLAGEMGLLGFQDICLIIKENISDMLTDASFTDECVLHIKQWPDVVKQYLSDTVNLEYINNLLDYLGNPLWPNPLSEEDSKVIKEMMGGAEEPETNLDATIVTSNKEVQDELNEILDDIIDTNDILAAPHTISKDLVDMLREEVILLLSDVNEYIEKITSNSIDQTGKTQFLSEYSIRIERFGSACQAAEMDGLHQACMVFCKNLNKFVEEDAVLNNHQVSLLQKWPERILSYLENPGDEHFCDAIVDVLQDSSLPEMLIKEISPALINLLKAIYISEKDINKEERQKVATADDVSIELPADINQELLDGLLQELPGQTESFSASIQALIDGSGDISEVQKAQRVAHTVKGAANTVGVKGIAILTHQLEDILNLLSQLNHLPSPALATTLMDASDCLEEMSEALLEKGSAPSHSQEVLQSVLDWANRIDNEGAECLKSDAITSETASGPKKDVTEKEQDEESANIPILRVPANLIDEILRLMGENMIVTSQLQEKVRISNLQAQRLIEHQSMVKNLAADLEVQVDVKGTAYEQKQAVNQNEVFDSLELEEYNELHTVTHQIVEAAMDSYEFNQEIARDFRELDELLIEKERLHHEIQELTLRTRMVPIKTIMPRLQRIVRQTCRTTKKQATLEIAGTETLVDSDILNNLIDPLMHMLRNAIDHGIESPDTRKNIGKDTTGKITLQFYREGTQIVVRCQDDGAGLDHEKILSLAIKRGLVDANDHLSDNEINRLILNPGFSTRQQATQTSGRGIGMDVVHTELLALKGSVHIESEQGNGCLVELRLPVTLMSSHALLLRHLSQIIAVSNHGIEKILHPSDSQIIKNDDGSMYCEVDGERLEMLTLESLLNLPEDRRNDDRETRPALLIREEELNHVIYIQEIVDTRDLFIKSMGKYLNNIKGLLGATILGDGSVVPVIDLPELIRSPVTNVYTPGELTHTNVHQALPVALVVDDSLSARRALAQVIQDAGFDVRTAKDGLEAVGIIEKKKPDIMLVDMEMPRMNGMELTSHVRGSKQLNDIPVVMITSRSTEKHRKQAEDAGVNVYMTKPFSEDDLLDHVHVLLN